MSSSSGQLSGADRTTRLTSFEADEVLNHVLHELILRNHVPLKVDHLANDGLVIRAEVAHVLLHRRLRPREVVELAEHARPFGATRTTDTTADTTTGADGTACGAVD